MRAETYAMTEPIDLFVEIFAGSLEISTDIAPAIALEVEGKHADEVRVEQQEHSLAIYAPKPQGLGSSADWQVHIRVTIPPSSDVKVQSGSADVTQRGIISKLEAKAGSGVVFADQVSNSTLIDTGSGRISVNDVHGDVRLRTGSGGVLAGLIDAEAMISTGSGEAKIVRFNGELNFKTGSGGLTIDDACGAVRARTGSGTVSIGRIEHGEIDAKTGSGDVQVGVPTGTPVWTDVLSGRPVESTLPSAGEPKSGQNFVRLHARTGSGVVRLAPSDA